MTQLSNEEKLRQGIKKLLGDHKGPTEDLKKGEFRSWGDLYLQDIKLPNISNESITVFEMPIKIVPPFIVKSPSNGTKKKNMRTNGDNNEHKSLIQDRAKVIYEILVKGLKNNDGKIDKYPTEKQVYCAKDKEIEQCCFEYKFQGVDLTIIVVNHYGNAIYITKKQLNLDSDNPRRIKISELLDEEATVRLYGKKDIDIFESGKEEIEKRLLKKIKEIV